MFNDDDPATRRTVLAALSAVAGAGAVNPVLAAQAPTASTAPSPEPIDVRRAGAVGDAAADDAAPFARAIDAAARRGEHPSRVLVPAGRYRRSQPIRLPQRLTLEGEGAASIIDSQNDPAFTKPILQNAQPYGLVGLRLRNLSLHGGSHGLYLDAAKENADLVLDNVNMLLQSVANIQCNKLFQTVKMFGCTLGNSLYGLRVDDWATTAFVSVGTEWIDHRDSALWLRGVEGVTVIGGRFEGGGRADKITLDIERGAALTFLGVYFENVHETLARFRSIAGGVVFQNCHFSGTKTGGETMKPFRWDIDDTVVVFRDCHSKIPMSVEATVRMEGANHNIHVGRGTLSGDDSSGALAVAPFVATETPRSAIALLPPAGVTAGPLHGVLDVLLDPTRPNPERHRFDIAIVNGAASVVRPPDSSRLSVGSVRDANGKILITVAAQPRGSVVDARFTWRQPGSGNRFLIRGAAQQ